MDMLTKCFLGRSAFFFDKIIIYDKNLSENLKSIFLISKKVKLCSNGFHYLKN